MQGIGYMLWAMAMSGEDLPEVFGALYASAAAKVLVSDVQHFSYVFRAMALASEVLPEVNGSQFSSAAAKVSCSKVQGNCHVLGGYGHGLRGPARGRLLPVLDSS